MKFNINQFIYAFDEGDEVRLMSIANSYQCDFSMGHVDENDYSLMELLLNVIIDRIYDMPGERGAQGNRFNTVQDEYFNVLFDGISVICDNTYRCADRLVDKIGKVPMSSWELAQTLLVISGTEDKRYFDLMKKYKDHEDPHVREVVEEYFYDIKMNEENHKRLQEKGVNLVNDLETSDIIEVFFDVMVDRFFDVKDLKIKGNYFKRLRSSITDDIGKGYDIIYRKCIDQLAEKIKKVPMSSWELAETLKIIGCTRDKRYWGVMEQYQDHEDAYVREMVQDYFYDMGKKEEDEQS